MSQCILRCLTYSIFYHCLQIRVNVRLTISKLNFILNITQTYCKEVIIVKMHR